jgi:hypothetical protein
MRTRALVVGLVGAAIWVGATGPAEARNLRRTLSAPVAGQVPPGAPNPIAAAIQPIGAVIGAQIANQIPTLSTSAGFTYEYNPELEVYERSTQNFGPLFSERAVTIGKGRFNINFSYTYIDFNTINGHDIDDLNSRVETGTLNGQNAFAGLRRPDLAPNFRNVRFNNGATADLPPDLIFSDVKLDLDLEAQLFAFSFTYGVLDNLDVNFDLPLIRTYARSEVTETTLDPRFIQEANIDPTSVNTFVDTFAKSKSSFGVGDMRLRAKYQFLGGAVRMAALMDLILPTGSPGNFQGTGDTRLGNYIIASGTVWDIFEPHAQAGIEFNCNDVDISQAKYVAGVTAQLFPIAAFTIDFIGRSEFGPLGRIPAEGRLPAVNDGVFTEPPPDPSGPGFHGRPVFVNINRNDILDLSVGGKVQITPQSVFFASLLMPLNDDGLRAAITPTVGFEATF